MTRYGLLLLVLLGCDRELGPARAISGTVLSATGTPLPSVFVTLARDSIGVKNAPSSAWTDSAGRYVLPVLQDGAYYIRARKIGYRGADSTIALAPGTSANVNLTLTQSPIEIIGDEFTAPR